jgi:hypothetical protein
MDDQIDLTPEWAEFIAAWLRQTIPNAPPRNQRDLGEWLLEGLDALRAKPADEGPAE